LKDALQNQLEKIIKEYAQKKGASLPEDFQVELNVSHDPSHGDLSTPVAFRLARWVKEKPALIADELALLFKTGLTQGKAAETLVTRWEVAGGGFINFFVPSSHHAEILLQIHAQDANFGKSDFGGAKKVLIEFVSANPTGPLTIAHGRQAAVGDALARILEATGHQVTREYYLNDTGRQMDLLGQSLWARYRELFGTPAELPEEGYRGEYLKEIALKLRKLKGDSLLAGSPSEAVSECSKFAAEEILRGIREDLSAIGVTFEVYSSERSLREKKLVEKAIEALKKKGLIYEEGGALWFRSTASGDDKDRVLRKQTGEYTYLAPDIAYHEQKFDRGFVWLINLWGPDHHGYIPRLKAACQSLGHDPEQLKILMVQLVTLYRQGEPVRMSTRAGEFVTLKELCDEVGPDVTRFFFLLRRIESHLDFDLDLAKTQSDANPVYYLQYAHARISSLLEFAKRKADPKTPLDRLGASEEVELMKLLQDYPQILIQASQALEPYRLVEYLRELAAQFHKFYSLHRVVTEDEALTRARLLLADGVRVVLRNGLATLGVSHPEKM
jgi:arginyl-tRNA synthetase